VKHAEHRADDRFLGQRRRLSFIRAHRAHAGLVHDARQLRQDLRTAGGGPRTRPQRLDDQHVRSVRITVELVQQRREGRPQLLARPAL